MPIQFTCPGCGNPIEVDAPLAGKAAQCPYCSRVVTVPAESTLSTDTIPTARPGGLPPPPRGAYGPAQPPPLHVGYTTQLREKAAARFGNIALFCAVATVLLGLSSGMLFVSELLKIVPES